jgi:hypothetical protein
MGYPNKERCIKCSRPIPDLPEDACYEELLCDSCLDHEDEEEEKVSSPPLSTVY